MSEAQRLNISVRDSAEGAWLFIVAGTAIVVWNASSAVTALGVMAMLVGAYLVYVGLSALRGPHLVQFRVTADEHAVEWGPAGGRAERVRYSEVSQCSFDSSGAGERPTITFTMKDGSTVTMQSPYLSLHYIRDAERFLRRHILVWV